MDPAPYPTTLELHGLASRLTLTLVGARAAELRQALETAWTRCLAPFGPESRAEGLTIRLRDEGEEASFERVDLDGTRLDVLLQQTTQLVTRAFITAQTGRLLMFHAGACAHPVTGDSVVYVAPGRTGKTTLSRVLGRTMGYLTDETVGVGVDGVISPYPKPLSIRDEGVEWPKRETSPDDLHLLHPPASPRVARIVLLDRVDRAATTPSLTELDLADAIVALAPETSALSALPRPLHLLADLLEANGPVLRCTYSDAHDLAPALEAMLGPAT